MGDSLAILVAAWMAVLVIWVTILIQYVCADIHGPQFTFPSPHHFIQGNILVPTR